MIKTENYWNENTINEIRDWAIKNNDQLVLSLLDKINSRPNHTYDLFYLVGNRLFQKCYYTDDKKLISNTLGVLLYAKDKYENKLKEKDGLVGIYYNSFSSEFAYYEVLYSLYIAFMPTNMIYGGDDSDIALMKEYIHFDQEFALECLTKMRGLNCALFSPTFALAYYYFSNHYYEKAKEIIDEGMNNISEYDKIMYGDLVDKLLNKIEELSDKL